MSRSNLFAIMMTLTIGLPLCCILQAELTGQSNDLSPANTKTQFARFTSNQANSNPDAKSSRLREGAKLENVLGRFEATGDRIAFYRMDGEESIRTLENLALERVSRELTGLPRERMWRVSGVVTEFRGNNFLLIESAVLAPDVKQLSSFSDIPYSFTGPAC